MTRPEAIKMLKETERFLKKCHKAWKKKHEFDSNMESEAVRRYNNFLLIELDMTIELVEKNEKK